jgi:N-terminal acetyltransferase B complex catalytic subunit
MATVRRVRPADLLKLNLCNLDALTENYDLNFYLTYLMKWPSLFQCIEEHGKIVGYSTAPLPSPLVALIGRPRLPRSL